MYTNPISPISDIIGMDKQASNKYVSLQAFVLRPVKQRFKAACVANDTDMSTVIEQFCIEYASREAVTDAPN